MSFLIPFLVRLCRHILFVANGNSAHLVWTQRVPKPSENAVRPVLDHSRLSRYEHTPIMIVQGKVIGASADTLHGYDSMMWTDAPLPEATHTSGGINVLQV